MRKPEMLSEHSKQAEDMVVQGSPVFKSWGEGMMEVVEGSLLSFCHVTLA